MVQETVPEFQVECYAQVEVKMITRFGNER